MHLKQDKITNYSILDRALRHNDKENLSVIIKVDMSFCRKDITNQLEQRGVRVEDVNYPFISGEAGPSDLVRISCLDCIVNIEILPRSKP